MRVRPFAAGDAAQADAILAAVYEDDPVLHRLSSVHGDGSFVADDAGTIVGVATAVASARHPSRLFLAGGVHPARRGEGIGGRLLAEVRAASDERPLLVRSRHVDAFLRSHGFGVLMRNRTATVDPAAVLDWSSDHRDAAGVVCEAAALADLAAAHERAYAREHASWAPAVTPPLEDSLRVFCGPSLDAASAFVARRGETVVGVASLHGAPFAEGDDELALIAGTTADDDPAVTRMLVARQLERAAALGKLLSIEADEANASLWAILDELPACRFASLLLLSTDAPVTPGAVAT